MQTFKMLCHYGTQSQFVYVTAASQAAAERFCREDLFGVVKAEYAGVVTSDAFADYVAE